MTSSTLHPLAEDYLARLREAASRLPPDRRDDLIAEIEAHLAESIPPDATEAQVRTALDRLGDPAQIVAAEGLGPPAVPHPSHRGPLEWIAIGALLVGGIVVPVIGWFVGVVLLWISQAWTLRDKLVGTLVVPFGLLPAVLFSVFGLTWPAQVCIESSGTTFNPANPSQATQYTASRCTGGTNGWLLALAIAIWVALFVLPVFTAIYLGRRAARSVPPPA